MAMIAASLSHQIIQTKLGLEDLHS